MRYRVDVRYFFHLTIIYEERYSSKVWRRKWKKILDVYVLPFAGEKGKVRRSEREREIRSGQFLSQVDERTVRLRCQRTSGTCAGASAVKKQEGERERREPPVRLDGHGKITFLTLSLVWMWAAATTFNNGGHPRNTCCYGCCYIGLLSSPFRSFLSGMVVCYILNQQHAVQSKRKKQKKRRNKNKCNLESDRYLPEFFKSTAGSWNKTNPWRYAYCCVRI